MPVFTFEKISPPIRRATTTVAPAAKKPRSVIVQMLDRFVEARVKRVSVAENVRPPRKRGK